MIDLELAPPFCRSRDPLLELRRTTPRREADDQAWFRRFGAATFTRFLRELRQQRLATSVRLAKHHFRQRTPLGEWTFATSELSLELDGQRPIVLAGEGQDPQLETARVISTAEAIERLAFLLQVRSSRLLGAVPRPTSTNGTCLHTSPTRVVVGAVCELLERDAFLTNWYSDQPLPVMPVAPGSILEGPSRAFARAGWQLRPHVWRHDLAPAYCSMISLTRQPVVPGEWSFFIGGGASFDRDEALRRALREALFLWAHFHRRADRVDVTEKATARLLEDPRSRTVYFQRPDAIATFLGRLRPRAMPTKRMLATTASTFIDAALERVTDLRLDFLPLPTPLAERVFCVQAATTRLQGLDWHTPPHILRERVRSLYGTRGTALTKHPHPVG